MRQGRAAARQQLRAGGATAGSAWRTATLEALLPCCYGQPTASSASSTTAASASNHNRSPG